MRLQKTNAKTIPDRHPLPRVQNILDNIGGNQYFNLVFLVLYIILISILDQSKAYHQLHIHPDSRKLAAFIRPWGCYEWVKIPFGLMKASGMPGKPPDYWHNFAVPYFDHLLVFSKTFEEHLNHIKLLLQRLKKYGFKIKPSKCNFFK